MCVSDQSSKRETPCGEEIHFSQLCMCDFYIIFKNIFVSHGIRVFGKYCTEIFNFWHIQQIVKTISV